MIGAIESAIIARIKAASASGVLGYSLRTVASYGAELDGDLATVVPKFPAAWVVFGGESRPDERAQGGWVCRPSFAVVVASRSVRNEQARRQGGPAGEIGAYQVVEDIRALLAGQDLKAELAALGVSAEITPLEPDEITAIFNGTSKGLQASVYAIGFTTDYDLAMAIPSSSDAVPFLRFHADWDVPPFNADADQPPIADLPLAPNKTNSRDDVILEP